MNKRPANALTIAGSDSGGGAGIQADLKTFSALGVYGASVITALTAQNTVAVSAIMDVEPTFIRAQFDAVCSDISIDAVKVGMLSRIDVIKTVAAALRDYRLRYVVIDPVMVAKSGDRLLQDDAIDALRTELLPLASVITPNLPEAAALLETAAARDEGEMVEQAKALLQTGCQAVLLKGGHLTGSQSIDLLLTGDEIIRFPEQRIKTTNTHGTGCTLSSAICAGLASGFSLVAATSRAKQYITGAIRNADRLDVGQGHGPVHHFYRIWKHNE